MDTQLTRTRGFGLTAVVLTGLLCGLPAPAAAQGSSQNEPIRITAPPLVVTAAKEPAESTTLPLSVTAVSGVMLDAAGDTTISEAGIYSPNT